MNSTLENGLFLPIRFYETKEEQDRYKSQSEGVALIHANYIHVDCNALAPFQIIQYDLDEVTDISWAIICSDTEYEFDLPASDGTWEIFYGAENKWVSYLGIANFDGVLANGMYYLVVNIQTTSGVKTYYSDLFVISNSSVTGTGLYGSQELRKTSPSNTDTRLIDIDTTELRIIKN